MPFVEFGLTRGFKDIARQGTRVAKLVVTRLASGTTVRVDVLEPAAEVQEELSVQTKTLKRKATSTQIGLTGLFKNRRLPPLTRIELRITKSGSNGKLRRFQVRSAGSPTERTLCLIAPKTTTATKCPADEL